MRLIPSCLVVLLGLAPSLVAAGTSQHGIINGEAIDSDDFPSAAALIVQADIEGLGAVTQVSCTATLIAPDTVLTAGHCVDEYPLTFGLLALNSLAFCVSFEGDLSEMVDPAHQGNPPLPDDAVCSTGFVQHPDFDMQAFEAVDGLGHFDDVALVFLDDEIHDRPFSFLPDELEADAIVVDLDVDIVGYGQRDAAPMDPFGTPPDPLRHWTATFVNEVGEYELQIGDGPETGRKCHGDSGGPTFAEIGEVGDDLVRVIGVTSHAYDESDCEKGGVDTRVDPYLAWIDEAMRDACDEGLRSWCDEPGIPEPAPSAEGDDDDDDDDGGGQGCQSCASSVSNGGPSGWLLGGLLVIGAAVLRRR